MSAQRDEWEPTSLLRHNNVPKGSPVQRFQKLAVETFTSLHMILENRVFLRFASMSCIIVGTALAMMVIIP